MLLMDFLPNLVRSRSVLVSVSIVIRQVVMTTVCCAFALEILVILRRACKFFMLLSLALIACES